MCVCVFCAYLCVWCVLVFLLCICVCVWECAQTVFPWLYTIIWPVFISWSPIGELLTLLSYTSKHINIYSIRHLSFSELLLLCILSWFRGIGKSSIVRKGLSYNPWPFAPQSGLVYPCDPTLVKPYRFYHNNWLRVDWKDLQVCLPPLISCWLKGFSTPSVRAVQFRRHKFKHDLSFIPDFPWLRDPDWLLLVCFKLRDFLVKLQSERYKGIGRDYGVVRA